MVLAAYAASNDFSDAPGGAGIRPPPGRATCCEQGGDQESARALSRHKELWRTRTVTWPKVANTVLFEHFSPRGAMSVEELSPACGLG